jgi:protein-disulfide isomerase
MRRILILIITGIFVLSACNQETKNEIIIYGDYKCPYCKKLEESIMPKLKKDYIDKGKVKFTYVNMAFLGEDSIKGSRAGHAVQNIAPKEFLDFQKNMFSVQPNHEEKWITDKLLDKQIGKLDISKKKEEKIKKDYKIKGSQSWNDAKEDKIKAKEEKIKLAPSVFINDKEIEDVYNFNEYKKRLNNN